MTLNQKPVMYRVGVLIWVTLFALIVVAHAPWEGYRVMSEFGSIYDFGDPPVSDTELNPFYWYSKAPVYDWFASFTHAFVAVVATSVVMGAWLYLFKGLTPERPDAGPSEDVA